MKVTQSCPTLCDPNDYTVHGILQARILEWVAFPFSRGSSQPRDRTQSPTLQADSLPVEPQGKPKNTGVDSLFLLKWIYLTQESNWGLLHCRRILLHCSYTNLHSNQHCISIPFSLQPYQHALPALRQCLIPILMSIFVMISDIEHFFKYLLAV